MSERNIQDFSSRENYRSADTRALRQHTLQSLVEQYLTESTRISNSSANLPLLEISYAEGNCESTETGEEVFGQAEDEPDSISAAESIGSGDRTNQSSKVEDLPLALQGLALGAANHIAQNNGNLMEFDQTLQNALCQADQHGHLDQFLKAVNLRLQEKGCDRSLKALPQTFREPFRTFVLEVKGGLLPNASIVLPIGGVTQELKEPAKSEDPLESGILPKEFVEFARRTGSSHDDRVNRHTATVEFERSGGDARLVAALKAINATANIHEAKEPADALVALRELMRLGKGSDENFEASLLLKALSTKLGGSNKVEQLLADLAKSGDSGRAALHLLQGSVPSSEDKLNGLRTRAIAQRVQTEPSVESLQKAKQELEAEVKAGNQQSKDWLNKVDVILDVRGLSDPSLAERSVTRLADAAKAGNQYARDALTAVIMPGDKVPMWKEPASNIWGDHFFRDKDLPNMSQLNPEQLRKVHAIAITGLRDASQSSGEISRFEASALGLALVDSINRQDKLAPLINDILGKNDVDFSLEKNTTVTEKTAAMRMENCLAGLFNAFTKTGALDNTPGSRQLANQYAQLCESNNNKFFRGEERATIGIVGAEFREQLGTINKLAAQGNRDAISILCAIAGGAGRSNDDARQPVIDRSRFSDVQAPLLSMQAGDLLVKIAKGDARLHQSIIDELSDNKQSGTLNDHGHRLETLGRVAALAPDKVSEKVRRLLRDGLAEPEIRPRALRGMLALGNCLDDTDVRTLALPENITTELVDALRVGAHKLSPERGSQLINQLASRVVDKAGACTLEQRMNALQAVTALGPLHATNESLAALQQLGGESGRRKLDEQLKHVLDTNGRLAFANIQERSAEIEKIQEATASALLSVVEQSPSTDIRTAAFKVLASREWGDSFQTSCVRTGLTRTRMLKLLAGNRENATIQSGVPRLIYGAEQVVTDTTRNQADLPVAVGRLAAAFRDKVAAHSDSTSTGFSERSIANSDRQLARLSELSIAKYGQAEAARIADRVSLFNALPPALRQQLTAFEGQLAQGKLVNLEGKTLDATTFNKLPLDVRLQITGTEKLLPQGETLSGSQLSGKTISASSVNNLEPALRKILTGTDALVQEEQVLCLEGRRVNAAVFNKLPAALRERLFGSSEPMKEAESRTINTKMGAEHFNQLSPELRKHLTGVDKLLNRGEFVEIHKKVIDARTFNSLTEPQRRILAGEATLLCEGECVPDLSRVFLPGKQINSSPELRKALGLTADLAQDKTYCLAGFTLDHTTFNRLSPEIQTAIAGRPGPLPEGRIINDLSHLEIDAKSFNALPAELRRSVSGSARKLDPELVLACMANGTLGDNGSITQVLTKVPPLEETVLQLQVAVEEKTNEAGRKLRLLQDQHQWILNELNKHSLHGLGFWNGKVAAASVSAINLNEFRNTQASRIEGIHHLESAVAQQVSSFQTALSEKQSMDIALRNFRFASLMREAKTAEADKLCLETMTRYGRAVLDLAPDMSSAFQGVGVLARKRANGESQFGTIQLNERALASDDPNRAGLSRGLEMLQSIRPVVQKPGDSRPHVFGCDAVLIRQEAFLGIDSDPTIQKLNRASQQVSEALTVLNTQVNTIAAKGNKFEVFIDDVQRRSVALRHVLQEIGPAECDQLYKIRESIRDTLESTKDPIATEELQKRLKFIDEGLQLFDPNYSVAQFQPEKAARQKELENEIANINAKSGPDAYTDAFSGTAGPGWSNCKPPNDALYRKLATECGNEARLNHEYWKARRDRAVAELSSLNPRAAIDKLLDRVSKPEAISASYFSHWVQTDGAELAGAVVGCAVLSALGPVALAPLLGTVGWTIGGAGIREVQHQYGIRDEGCPLGQYLRGRTIVGRDGLERPMDLLRDFVEPTTLELARNTATAFAAAEIGQAVGKYVGEYTGLNRIFPGTRAANQSWTNFASQMFQQSVWQQPRFLLTTHLVEEALGGESPDSAVVSFLAATFVSAVFASFHPKMIGQRTRPADPLKVEIIASREGVNTYVKEARRNGSVVEFTKDGGFIETTSRGCKIEFIVRRPSGGEAQPVGSDTNARPAERQQAIEDHELMSPVRKMEAQIAELESQFHSRQKELARRAASAPTTPEGTKDAYTIRRQLEQERHEHEKQITRLRQEASSLRQSIELSDEYQRVHRATLEQDVGFLLPAPAARREPTIEDLRKKQSQIDTEAESVTKEFEQKRDKLLTDIEAANKDDTTEETLRGALRKAEQEFQQKCTEQRNRRDSIDRQIELLGKYNEALAEVRAIEEEKLKKLDEDWQAEEHELSKQLDEAFEKGQHSTAETLDRKIDARENEVTQTRHQLKAEAQALKDKARQLKIALFLEQGLFAPGEYLVDLPSGRKVKLIVGCQTAPGITRPEHLIGDPVPEKEIRQLLKLMEDAAIVPDTVVIYNNVEVGLAGAHMRGTNETLAARARGMLGSENTGNQSPRAFHQIAIFSGGEFRRMIYNHETGHLWDYSWLRKQPGYEHLDRKIAEAYEQCLRSETTLNAAEKAAGVSEQSRQSFRESFVDELLNTEYHSSMGRSTPESDAKYLACRVELTAEMFMLYQEQQHILETTGRRLSYHELLERCTRARGSGTRAEVMQGFEPLYELLSKEAFSKFESLRRPDPNFSPTRQGVISPPRKALNESKSPSEIR